MSNEKINSLKVGHKVNYAIFASGEGSNAMALIEKGLELGMLPCFLLSNVEDAPILEKAKNKGVPTFFCPSKKKGIDQEFESKALHLCQEYQVSWIFLAGFLKILSGDFVSEFTTEGRSQLINIHPSLLPKYPGLGGYKRAFKAGDKTFGHTIHFVTEGVDEGPIILQKEFDRDPQWDIDQMIQFGKEKENSSYALILEKLLSGDSPEI